MKYLKDHILFYIIYAYIPYFKYICFIQKKIFSFLEIRRFWPPLRSLESLHDNIRFQQLDSFLKRLINVRTPDGSLPETSQENPRHDKLLLLN